MNKPLLDAFTPLHEQVERAIREAIESGALPAGSRLRPTAEWAADWSIHPTHLQRALKRLAHLGYLDRKPKKGTFVRQQRRVDRVAVLIAYPIEEERFYSLRHMVALLEERFAREGFDAHFFTDLYRRFAPEHQKAQPAEAVAASIRALHPVALVEIGFNTLYYPSMKWAHALPRTRLDAPLRGGELFLNVASFYEKAFVYLSARGITRVALVARESSSVQSLSPAYCYAETHGIEVTRNVMIEDRQPLMELDRLGREQLTQVFPEWRNLPAATRPEAILVVDDILMRGVARAWKESQPDRRWQPQLVVLGCKGIRHQYGVPVVRMEVSLEEFAEALVGLTVARLLDRALPPLPIGIPCRPPEPESGGVAPDQG